MGLFDIFNPKPAQPAPASPLPNGEISALENGNATGKPAVGADGKPIPAAGTAQVEVSPLDQYKDLWEPRKDDKGNVIPDAPKGPGITVDPAKIREHASKLDFRKVMDPATVQKALAGDAQAFMDSVNAVAQASFTSAFTASSQLLSKSAETQESRIFDRLPSELRKHTLSDTALNENPKLNHPAVRPLYESVQQQFASRYPDASTTDIKRMAAEYLTSTLELMAPADAAKNSDKRVSTSGNLSDRIAQIQSEGGIDWDLFASGEQQKRA